MNHEDNDGKTEGAEGDEGVQGGDAEVGVQEGAESEVETPSGGDSPVGSWTE